MRYNPKIHNRHSIRLKGYDYTQPGRYFITICTHKRECLFGHIANAEMHLNEYGEILAHCWHDLSNHYHSIALPAFIIMPNHIHGIISIINPESKIAESANNSTIVRAGFKPAPTATDHFAPTGSPDLSHNPEFSGSPNSFESPITPTIVRAGFKPAPTGSLLEAESPAPTGSFSYAENPNPIIPLTEIIRALKTFSSRRINEKRQTPGIPVWQRNYYEHIIRDETAYANICKYIKNNPGRWEKDSHHA